MKKMPQNGCSYCEGGHSCALRNHLGVAALDPEMAVELFVLEPAGGG